MNRITRISAISTVLAISIAASSAPAQAFEGSWTWTYKSCLSNGLRNTTWSNGSGVVSHFIDAYSASWNNGTGTSARELRPGLSQANNAGVDGLSTRNANYGCT
jgi:hypothetical protein